MDPLAIALIVALTAIGLLHQAWGLGLNWPGADPVSRAASVVGTPGRALLGFFSWTLLAISFMSGAVVVWIGQQPITHPLHAIIAYAGYVVLILLFSLRGLAPYLTSVFNYARGTPFYTLNRRYYAPLCLMIAAALIADFPSGLDRFILSSVKP